VIPPEDAYSISPFSSFDSHKSYRYIFKKFINIILNTRSIPGAIEACLNALPDIFADLVDEGLPLIDSINSAATVASLIEAFVDHHASIRHLLFKKQGVKLFVTEGDICIEIIRRCTFEGIPVLPIHDSFIVPAKHQSELREIMEQSWGKVTKERFSTPFTHVPRISIKY
jgi:hypothetical protein